MTPSLGIGILKLRLSEFADYGAYHPIRSSGVPILHLRVGSTVR